MRQPCSVNRDCNDVISLLTAMTSPTETAWTQIQFSSTHVGGKETGFSFTRAYHTQTEPAHEAHEDKQLDIAAEPDDMPEKAGGVCTVDYKNEGLLPVHLIIANDGNNAVSLANMKVMLI